MNTDVKVFNKIWASHIQQFIQRIIQHDPMGFIAGSKDGLNVYKSTNVIRRINKMKDKTKHDHLNRGRESIWKNSTPIYDKNSQ